MMIHGINYPDETGRDELEVRLWEPVMKDGVIEFIRPDQCKIVRHLRKSNICSFSVGVNFSLCDELYDLEAEGL